MQNRRVTPLFIGLMTLLVVPPHGEVGAVDPQNGIFGKTQMGIETAGPQISRTAFFWRRSKPTTVAGKWSITEGETPNGREYTGTLDVQAIGSTGNLYKVSWNTSQGNYSGLGFYEEGRLLVGYGLEEGIHGVALYRIEDDGTLDGQWTLSTANGEVGTETARGGRGNRLEGEYQITSTDPGQDSSFTGSLRINELRDTYQVVWKVDDQTYRGVGLRSGDWLVVGWGPGDDFAVSEYEFDGNKATARWAVSGSGNLGVEKISLED